MEELKKRKIQLSICIPTINRGGRICATLESIVCQAGGDVEIVVVDGGSTDNTAEVISRFQSKFPSLRYYRKDAATAGSSSLSPSSGGFDRDCNRAVELARGQYCWLFTDDDILKPGAIERVLAAIRQGYELIVVNAEVRCTELSTTLEASRLRLAGDRTYTPDEWQTLFADTAEYLSFVGAVVVQRQLWIARQREPYFGTGFIHFGVIFQRPLRGEALAIAEPLIAIRYGDALYMRTSRYFEIWMFDWPELIWSLPSLPAAVKLQLCPKEPWRKLTTLLLLRARGAFSIFEYNRWLKERLNSRWDRLLARLIAGFPGCLLNLLGIMHYHWSGRMSGMYLADLVKSPFYFLRAFRDPDPLRHPLQQRSLRPRFR